MTIRRDEERTVMATSRLFLYNKAVSLRNSLNGVSRRTIWQNGPRKVVKVNEDENDSVAELARKNE